MTALTRIAIFLSLGIIVARYGNINIFAALVACSASLLFSLITLRRSLISRLAMYLAVFFLGAFTFAASARIPSDHISLMTTEEKERVSVEGAVSDDPVVSSSIWGYQTTFLLDARLLKKDGAWRKTRGTIKVALYRSDKVRLFECGDEIILEGVLSGIDSLKNPELFDYAAYQHLKGIYRQMKVASDSAAYVVEGIKHYKLKRSASAVRRSIGDAIDTYFVFPHNSFLRAILVGDRSEFPNAIEEDFMKTGTIHILSVSGSHVGLIASVILFTLSLAGVGRKVQHLIAIPILIFYAYIAGLSPPIVRATIMYTIFAIGLVLDRDSDGLNSLALAAMLMFICNPQDLFDPGLQLSFASIAAISILYPTCERMLHARTVRHPGIASMIWSALTRGLSLSLAAWAGVVPIVALYFNILSPVALIANLIIVPLVFAAMVISIVCIMSSAISPFLAGFIASAVTWIDQAIFAANHLASALPLAYLRVGAPTKTVFILYYLVLAYAVLSPAGAFKRHGIILRLLKPAALLVSVAAIWAAVLSGKGEEMRAIFLDTGKGDAAIIKSSDGRILVVDAGPGGYPDRFDAGRSIVAPYLWNHGYTRIDMIVVTHFHEDHLGGVLYLLENFDVRCVADAGNPEQDSALFRRYLQIVSRRGIRRVRLREGDEIFGFDHSRILVFSPARGQALKDANADSVVLQICAYGKKMLLLGDITSETMSTLSSYGKLLKSDLTKRPHHGGEIGDKNVAADFFAHVDASTDIVTGRIPRRAGVKRRGADAGEITTPSRELDTRERGAVEVIIRPGDMEVKQSYGII